MKQKSKKAFVLSRRNTNRFFRAFSPLLSKDEGEPRTREFFSPFFHFSRPFRHFTRTDCTYTHTHLHVTMFSLQTINTCQRVASFKLASTSKRSASSSLRAVVEPKENGSMDETVADAVQSAEKAFEMADATPAGEQAQAPRAMQAMMYVYSTFFHSLSFSCCSR